MVGLYVLFFFCKFHKHGQANLRSQLQLVWGFRVLALSFKASGHGSFHKQLDHNF